MHGVFAFWAGVMLATLEASALRGVVAPAFGGGEAVVEPLALAFGLALALAWGAGAASAFLSLSALDFGLAFLGAGAPGTPALGLPLGAALASEVAGAPATSGL